MILENLKQKNVIATLVIKPKRAKNWNLSTKSCLRDWKKDFDIEGQCINLEFEDFYLVNVYVLNVGRKLVTLPKRLEWNVHFEARRLWRMVFFILLSLKASPLTWVTALASLWDCFLPLVFVGSFSFDSSSLKLEVLFLQIVFLFFTYN